MDVGAVLVHQLAGEADVVGMRLAVDLFDGSPDLRLTPAGEVRGFRGGRLGEAARSRVLAELVGGHGLDATDHGVIF